MDDQATTTSRLLSGLIAAGVVAQRATERDRQVSVSLTNAGFLITCRDTGRSIEHRVAWGDFSEVPDVLVNAIHWGVRKLEQEPRRKT